MTIVDRPIQRNFSSRQGFQPRAIVIHIAQGTTEGAYHWFGQYNPNPQVSSHYIISKQGVVTRFVGEEYAAWHAGGVSQPSEPFRKHHDPFINPNLYTIGIEHEGFTGQKFEEPMLKALQALTYDIAKRYGWQKLEHGKNILGHNDINSVTRGSCPGIGIHLTNDIILPINKKLMSGNSSRDQRLFNLLMIHRVDDENFAEAGITEKNIWDAWIIGNNGWVEIAWALGRNGVILPAEKTPDAIVERYLAVSPNINFTFTL